MATICPYCAIEISESAIEAEDGCCPECGAVLSVRSMYDDEDDEGNYDDDGYGYDDEDEDFDDMDERDFFDDDFEDDFDDADLDDDSKY